MNDRTELTDLVADIMKAHAGPDIVETSERSWSADLWAQLDETGLTAVGIDESAGGSGGTFADAAAVIRAAARAAAPVPLVGTLLLAPHLRTVFGAPHRRGPSAVAVGSVRAVAGDDGVRLEGTITEVAYGRIADTVLVLGRDEAAGRVLLAEIPGAEVNWEQHENLAGEPRDSAELSLAVTALGALPLAELDGIIERLRDIEALGLSLSIAGALHTVQELTVGYANERAQFGKPISKFQAVKQLAAVLAGEVAVTDAAVSAAVDLVEAGAPAGFPIAAARLRAALAATEVSKIAHQIHGAIGYTREYRLHQYTRRLWSWRDEGRSEAQWSEIAGQRVLANGPDRVWETLVG
ncbi:acyl-CoA dehydrogenase family protein [Nocardia jinanensis]|uniref:Acyl-CoA dehydrogenase n=1 Tax=Nocardia jinanensis TaxID=382504 RepID=A0A917RL70_9NOCA|nr:acyl-CoA dehydrogenase family protein [Nocardia jinanensis]GGL12655.1 acyl-CoA dehydrogenase [Nocardia jinanensis]